MLEFISSFNGSGDIMCITDLINEFEETLDVFVADRVDGELCSKCIKRNADFEDGTNLLITHASAVVIHDRNQCIQSPFSAEICYISSTAGFYGEESFLLQLTDPAVDNRTADLHHFSKLAFRWKFLSDL